MDKQILIVDDDQDVKEVLFNAFIHKSYEVSRAYNGAEELALLTPDI